MVMFMNDTNFYDTIYSTSQNYVMKINCFYEPLYINKKIVYLGGSFRRFYDGKKLPLKTLYYEYPKDFYVLVVNRYTPHFKYELALIKNGVFKKFLSINEFEYILPVYSYWGNRIKVETVDDLKEYLKDLYNVSLSYYEISDKWHYKRSLEQQIGELFYCLFAEQNCNSHDSFENIINITNCIEDFKNKYPKDFKIFLNKNSLEWKGRK